MKTARELLIEMASENKKNAEKITLELVKFISEDDAQEIFDRVMDAWAIDNGIEITG